MNLGEARQQAQIINSVGAKYLERFGHTEVEVEEVFWIEVILCQHMLDRKSMNKERADQYNLVELTVKGIESATLNPEFSLVAQVQQIGKNNSPGRDPALQLKQTLLQLGLSALASDRGIEYLRQRFSA